MRAKFGVGIKIEISRSVTLGVLVKLPIIVISDAFCELFKKKFRIRDYILVTVFQSSASDENLKYERKRLSNFPEVC